MKTEIRVPLCLLIAFQALTLQAQTQQTATEPFNCRGFSNTSTLQTPVQSADIAAIPAVSNAGGSGPWFGDYAISTSLDKSLRRRLLDEYPDGLKMEYAGSTLVQSESLGTFRGISIQLRYTDGYPDFSTDPMKNTPQDNEMRRRAARRVLLFGGNTFFYSANEGTGMFLGQKKRSCFFFSAARNGLQGKLTFGF